MGGMSGGGGGGMGGMITNIASSVANVGAGWFASRQLNRGAAAQRDAQTNANALYTDLYGQTQSDYAPYQQAGTSALDALMRTYGLAEGQNGKAEFNGFENADYKFAFGQGQQALDRSAASKGRLYSGQQMKASQNYGQGAASQYLNSYRGGLQNIASGGMAANNALANYRGGYSDQMGNGLTAFGDIEMARRLGRANINYRNVAAQDSIWGSGAGGQQGGGGNALGGGQSSYGGNGYSSGFNSMNTSGGVSGPGTSSYNFNPWGG
jgi:hypothetical protein